MLQDGTSTAASTRLRSPLPRHLGRQLLLLVPVLIDLVVQMLTGEIARAGGFYATGLTLVVLLTAATALTAPPWRVTLPPVLVAALPFLDLAAIGLMRLVPSGNGLGVLMVLPAMWLAADHRMRGVAAGAAASLAVVSVPSLLYLGTDAAVWSRALLVPVVATMCAITVAGTGQVWQRQNQVLESQGERLEQALAEVMANRALNDAIVTTVDVGLLAVDCQGRFTYTNPRMQEFLELAYPDGHLGIAGQLGELYGADRHTSLTAEESPCFRALETPPFADLVMWVGRPDRPQRALSVSAASVLDADGRPDGAVLAYHDITDLMAALNVKDEFVASVSHELRTPLTSILGFLEMVVEDPSLTPPVRRQLQVVIRNAQRLLRLVGDVLLSAQIDTGHLALEIEPVDLTAVVSAALVDQGPSAADRGVTVQSELCERVVVGADPVRIGQVVEHLISNAVKYTGPGGGVMVSLEASDDAAVLTVADTGMGIAAEDLDRLFTRFFRTKEAEQQAIQGVGLGLAITRSIVEAHGGRIEVESELHRGSTFRVTLPSEGDTLPRHGERVTPAESSPAGAGAAVRRLPPA